MNAESISVILEQAIEIASATERADYVHRACAGDRALEDRIAKLVQVHFASGRFLEPPATSDWMTRTTGDHSQDRIGTRIGPYTLLEQLGEGGMGVVYLAEQSSPVRRQVAIKIIKPGMDTRQIIARFEVERQALALMDHSHIARILDAGTTNPSSTLPDDPGRPYFVMELVRGVPMTDFCDQQQLTVVQRLELFVRICRGVQHAHTNGIIHRDLKPTNLLVTLQDGVPVPKIIDFGVAKAIHEPLTDRTLLTHCSQLLGTPMYMSPEQADLSGLGIDTRSDVFSLGVVLYQLLTGTTPVHRDMEERIGYDELRRMIREEEPQRVSDRIGTLSPGQQTTISTRRGVDARTLQRQTRGEIDWIVMKALEKDRTRRYESASAFADDVERYLRDEPVAAGPPSAAYRIRKLARRHRVVIASGSLIAIGLLVATGVSLWKSIEANAARQLALASLELADTRLASEMAARLDASREWRRAESNFQQALAAVDQLLTRVADERLTRIAGAEPVRKQMLEDALQFYRNFLQQNADHPELRLEIAQAWRRVGLVSQLLGQHADARGALAESIRIGERLAAESRLPDAGLLELLSESHLAIATLQVTNLPLNSDDVEALTHALRFRRLLQERSPGESQHLVKRCEIQRLLATAFRTLGRTQDAQNLLEETLGLLRAGRIASPDDSRLQLGLCACLTEWANLFPRQNIADSSLAEAIALGDALLHNDPDRPEVRETLVAALITQGGRLRGRQDWSGAEATYRRVLAVYDPLIAAGTNLSTVEFSWCWCQLQLAEICARTARPSQVEEAYGQAWHVLVSACRRRGGETKLLSFLTVAATGFGNALIETGRMNDAISVRRETLLVLEPLRNDDAVDDHLDDRIRTCRCLLADLLSRHNDTAEAEVHWNEVLNEFRAWTPPQGVPRQTLYPQALVHLVLGDLAGYRGVCAAMLQQSSGADRRTDRQWSNCVWVCVLGPEAVDDYAPVIALARETLDRFPESQPAALDLGAALFRAGRYDEALAVLQSANTTTAAVARVWYFLSLTQQALGRETEARGWLDQADQASEKLLAGTKLEDGTELTWERSLEFQLLRAECHSRLVAD